jgi:hypothetical protein
MKRFALALGLGLFALASPGRAGPLVVIGDVDGFGYGTAPGFFAANGGAANIGAPGVLTVGDYLPDINRDGAVATGRGDDFDLRGALELADAAVTAGLGVTITTGTTGSKFTDISLSTSYGTSQAANRVLEGGNPGSGLVFGPGGAFPDGSPGTLPNQPGFKFRFEVDKLSGAVVSGQQVFFNLIFGDYDVTPASIRITRNDGSIRTLPLMVQGAGADGLIQAATAVLDFGEVFSDGGAVWVGKLDVDFVAPNEPYTAFDFVELNTVALVVPVPPTIVLAGLGALSTAVAGLRRRRQVSAAA